MGQRLPKGISLGSPCSAAGLTGTARALQPHAARVIQAQLMDPRAPSTHSQLQQKQQTGEDPSRLELSL